MDRKAAPSPHRPRSPSRRVPEPSGGRRRRLRPAPGGGETAMVPGMTARQIEARHRDRRCGGRQQCRAWRGPCDRIAAPRCAGRVGHSASYGAAVCRRGGEAVVAGQPLASIRAAEPVQYGAALARAPGAAGVARAAAGRTSGSTRQGRHCRGRPRRRARAALHPRQRSMSPKPARILAQANADGSGMTRRCARRSAARISAVNVQAGGPVGGLSAPFIVENTARLMLDLQIPERLAGAVHPGTPSKSVARHAAPATGRVARGRRLDRPATLTTAKRASTPRPHWSAWKSVVAILGGVPSARASPPPR